VVKGIEGYLAGRVMERKPFGSDLKNIILSVTTGAIVLAAGYFLGEAFILKLFVKSFGYAAALAELPLNILQGAISAVVACLIAVILKKTGVDRYI